MTRHDKGISSSSPISAKFPSFESPSPMSIHQFRGQINQSFQNFAYVQLSPWHPCKTVRNTQGKGTEAPSFSIPAHPCAGLRLNQLLLILGESTSAGKLTPPVLKRSFQCLITDNRFGIQMGNSGNVEHGQLCRVIVSIFSLPEWLK